MNKGILYICATPIGNLEDITLRAIRILGECDGIACEDTRHSGKLLQHLGIKKPLYSYHEHNEQSRSEEILARIEAGEQIALISDAGLPGISDPGHILIHKAQAKGLPVTVLPGASAGVSALVLSGMPCDRFVFEGFLPSAGKERRSRLEALKTEQRTVILYESPHRLKRTLQDLWEALGGRKLTAVRELTKIHEEAVCLSLEQWPAYCEEHAPKGEYVLLLAGAQPAVELPNDESLLQAVQREMAAGLDKKGAVKKVAKDRGLPRNEVYMQATEL